jgi:hypothetical protein
MEHVLEKLSGKKSSFAPRHFDAELYEVIRCLITNSQENYFSSYDNYQTLVNKSYFTKQSDKVRDDLFSAGLISRIENLALGDRDVKAFAEGEEILGVINTK